MAKKKIKREEHEINPEIWDDYTCEGSWTLKGEVYEHVLTEHDPHADGEAYRVICKRKSDDKFFEFFWQIWSHGYNYGEELTQVFPEHINKVIYT